LTLSSFFIKPAIAVVASADYVAAAAAAAAAAVLASTEL